MTEIDLDNILKQVPLLAGIPARELGITPLPGLTNLNYHLRHRQDDYVLRIPGKYTSGFIDRSNEAFNTDLATRFNLAPVVLWRDAGGLSLTQCVRHSRKLETGDLYDNEVVESLTGKLAILHGPGLAFKGQTDIEKLLVDHFDLMPANRRLQLSGNFEAALRISRLIAEADSRLVSSHNDLVLENILIDDKRKLWLIDWEYSSLSSPYWDIATICNNSRLDERQRRHLLTRYCDRIDNLRLENLIAYQYILQLLTISWLTAYTKQPIEAEMDWLGRLKQSTNQF